MLTFTKQLQKGIEDTYSKTNIKKVVQEDIDNSDFKEINRRLNKAIIVYLTGSYYSSKQTRIQHVRNNVPIQSIMNELFIAVLSETGQKPIQSIASRLGDVFKFENVIDNVKTASEILAVCKNAGVYDIVSAANSETGSILIIPKFILEKETLDKIHKMKYLPPMICEPDLIHNNSQSGYLTKDESVILGANNHHEGYQAIDVLNIMGKIPLSLDRPTLKLEEKPKKDIDTSEKMSNFLRLIISSRKVYQELLSYGNSFYLNWRFDKRGRMYSQGHEVNIQSTSYKKALINLTKREIIK
jgi:hypothetical protein